MSEKEKKSRTIAAIKTKCTLKTEHKTKLNYFFIFMSTHSLLWQRFLFLFLFFAHQDRNGSQRGRSVDVHFTDFKVKISGWRNIVVPNHLGMNSAFTWETREHINSPPLTSQRTFPRPLGQCLPVWRWGTRSRFLGGSSSGRRRSSLGGCSFCKRKRTSIFP